MTCFLFRRLSDSRNPRLWSAPGSPAFDRPANLSCRRDGARVRQIAVRQQDLSGRPEGHLPRRPLRRLPPRLLRRQWQAGRLLRRSFVLPAGGAGRAQLGHLGQTGRSVERRPAGVLVDGPVLRPDLVRQRFQRARWCRDPHWSRSAGFVVVCSVGGRSFETPDRGWGRPHRNGYRRARRGDTCGPRRCHRPVRRSDPNGRSAGRSRRRDGHRRERHGRLHHRRRRGDDRGGHRRSGDAVAFRQTARRGSDRRAQRIRGRRLGVDQRRSGSGRHRVGRRVSGRWRGSGVFDAAHHAGAERRHQARLLPTAGALAHLLARPGAVRRRRRLRRPVFLRRRLSRLHALLSGRVRRRLRQSRPASDSAAAQTRRLSQSHLPQWLPGRSIDARRRLRQPVPRRRRLRRTGQMLFRWMHLHLHFAQTYVFFIDSIFLYIF